MTPRRSTTAIDIHFHIVPRLFVDALRQQSFAEAVEIVSSPDVDRPEPV
jgi:hypothetical protein